MARGDVRIAVTLACEECKRRNYQTNKSRRNTPDRIEMRKYCRWCGHLRVVLRPRLGRELLLGLLRLTASLLGLSLCAGLRHDYLPG